MMNNNNIIFPLINSTQQILNSPNSENIAHIISKNSLSNSSITKIATTNIRTLNKEKLIFTLDAMKNNNIDIYGLAETNLSKQQSKI
jgi:hypothetical protein